ncbi:MAG: hypothetical protein ACPGUH_03415 [Winogradskyella sp.]
MRHFFALLLILILGLTSCEGRKSQNQALAESIDNFKKNTSVEKLTYTPKNYTYQNIDTTFVNGFSIYNKLYIDMENSILVEEKNKNSIVHKTYIREGKADVIVKFKDEILFSETIDNTFILQTDATQKDTLKNMTLLNVFVDKTFSNQSQTNKTDIFIQFYNPKNTKAQLSYKLTINLNKKYTLQKIKNTNQSYTF